MIATRHLFSGYRMVLNCDTSTVAKFVFHGVNGSMTGLVADDDDLLPVWFLSEDAERELVVATAAAAAAVSVRRGPNNFT
mmetsp:Transcript_5848/g.8273  ORF Transcript_5848/g.8273 Transcript_5848/m.8273 type:complete len:80 (-) Transcript_5848:946-1185(-)